MTTIYAIANQKGGVGKTTTAINLSAALASKPIKARVLLIDLDPQGNASTGIGADNQSVNGTLELLLGEARFEDCVQSDVSKRLDVISANIDLAAAELSLTHTENTSDAGARTKLKKMIDKQIDAYDYVIIDCPPSLSLLTINALNAADRVIIPMQCEYFALEGLTGLINTINHIRKQLNPELIIDGLVRTMHDARSNLTKSVSEQLESYFPEILYKATIPRNIRLAEAPSHSESIIKYDKTSKGAQAYLSLAAEVHKRRQADIKK